MPSAAYEVAAGVVAALALIVEAPWLVAFAVLPLLEGPVGWRWAVVAVLVGMGEWLARRALPGAADRAALARVLTALWGLAAMAVAFGAAVGAGAWWVGSGHAVKGDRIAAMRAVGRMAIVRAGRVAAGLALVYLARG